MIADNVVKAIFNEVVHLPDVFKGAKKRGYTTLETMRFLARRILAPEVKPAGYRSYVTHEGLRLNSRRDFVMYQSLFFQDEYSADVWREDLARQSAPRILDVGANLGMFSALCYAINPHCNLLCYELMEECAGELRRHLDEIGCKSAEVVVAAVGDVDGGELIVRYDYGLSSTNRVDNLQGKKSTHVPRVMLDKKVKPPAGSNRQIPFMVKVDVEGAEAAVIKGGRDVMHAADYILMELHGSADCIDEFKITHNVVLMRKTTATEWICILRKK